MKIMHGLIVFGASMMLATSCCADVSFEAIFHIQPAEVERTLGPKRLKMLQEALDDYNAVLNYNVPIHAAFDKDAGLPADGGSTCYKARGYTITITKSLFGLRDGQKTISGFMYGPVLTLGRELGTGNQDKISHVSFYPVDTLNKLIKYE